VTICTKANAAIGIPSLWSWLWR